MNISAERLRSTILILTALLGAGAGVSTGTPLTLKIDDPAVFIPTVSDPPPRPAPAAP